jgi:hypothetical protein
MNNKIALLLQKTTEILSINLNNKFLYIIVGDNGVCLQYYEDNLLVDSYFSSCDALASDDNFKNFISKRPKARVRIVLNLKSTNIDHESIAVLSTISKANPIDKYAESHLHSSDIYSYKLLSIAKDNQDIWKYVILSTPQNDSIQRCLLYLSDAKIAIDGVYFYQFLLQDISSKIASEYKTNLENVIYTTTSITSSSGIIFTINYAGNILSSVYVEYPLDKTSEYVQGIIEQNISDLWIKFSRFAEENNLKKYNILIVPDALKNLLDKQTCGAELNLFSESNTETIFSDQSFTKYLGISTLHKASSKELKNYYWYTMVNNLIFKPAYLMIAIMVFYSAYINISNFLSNRHLSDLYDKFSKNSEEIRLKAQDYPSISNVSQLADLYNMHTILSKSKPLPFELLTDFIELNNDKNEISKIYWELTPNNEYSFFIELVLSDSSLNQGIGIQNIENIITKLKDKYKDILLDIQRVSSKKDEISNSQTSFTIKLVSRGAKDDN